MAKRWKSKESRARAYAGRGFVHIRIWRAKQAEQRAAEQLEVDVTRPMNWPRANAFARDAKADQSLQAFPTRPSLYPGRCARCGASYAKGDPILWLARGKAWCAACCVPR